MQKSFMSYLSYQDERDVALEGHQCPSMPSYTSFRHTISVL